MSTLGIYSQDETQTWQIYRFSESSFEDRNLFWGFYLELNDNPAANAVSCVHVQRETMNTSLEFESCRANFSVVGSSSQPFSTSFSASTMRPPLRQTSRINPFYPMLKSSSYVKVFTLVKTQVPSFWHIQL